MNHRKIVVTKWQGDSNSISSDDLAVESVVALVYNDQRIATLLASPTDLDALLFGHLFCEGYLSRFSLVDRCDNYTVTSNNDGYKITLSAEHPLAIKSRNSGITNTSCGACNLDGLDGIITDLPIVADKLLFDNEILHVGLENMRRLQVGFSKTGGMHCAGLLTMHGELIYVAEDIGRHNAVDKVIGKSILDSSSEKCILLLSGRCGWDIVAKAARANISCIAAIGAASTLAVDCARQLGIQIYSFVRQNSATIIG